MSTALDVYGFENMGGIEDDDNGDRLDGGWRGPHACGVSEWHKEGEDGYVVDLDKIPSGIRVLRFRVTR